MRPVNLIPPEERRGDRAPLRTGAVPYMLVGVLAGALLGVGAVAFTGKQIDDRKAERASLEARQAEAGARATALAPYARFAELSEARRATVTSLAESRFDWERILRELALVLPDDVWLTGMEAAGSSAAAESATDAITAPSLKIFGCGASHEAVARFLEALKDIDGVTRVGLSRSEKSSGSGEAGGGVVDCRTRAFISQFEVTAAFDEAPAVEPGAVPEEIEPVDPSTAAAAEDSGIADVNEQEQEARDATAGQTEKSRNAASNLVPGVAR